MKYIAYGSNMVEDQMAQRCRSARLLGTGYLPNHRLEFYIHATVEPDDTCTEGVPVAIWEITDIDEAHLDFYEGYPDYYTKQEATVCMKDGSQITGMVYVMNRHFAAPPSNGYYRDIRRAYEKLGFSSEIESVLDPALVRSWQRK